MRRIARLALASVALALVPARAALAVCGDGVLQAGEVCDASAPNGDVACRGACIAPALAGACTCAVPSDDARDFVLLAREHLRLGNDVVVIDGHAGVASPLGVLVVGKGATMPSASHAVGDFARLLEGAQVGRLFSRNATVKPGAVVVNGGPFPFTLPLPAGYDLPPFPAAAPGSTLVLVPGGETVVLAPGAYGNVLVDQDGTLVLRGLSPASGAGLYEIEALRVGFSGHVVAHNPVVVNVADRFVLGGDAELGPSPATGLVAGDVQVNVHGKRVGIARSSIVRAYIRAPQGSAKLGKGAFVAGRIVADQIASTAKMLTLEGACGDGRLDPKEACDASAPGGDAACPGTCIAGDPSGRGQIALGQPGQCTCRCTGDADCNDGDKCNGEESCQGGACVIGFPLECDDHNACTRDCDATLGCVNEPVANGTACSDGNTCTTGDTCQSGTCTAGAAVLDGSSCNDGDKCTVGDTCQAGACTGGAARDCSDDNTCSVDTCDPVAGCQHTLLANGDPCSDGNACTVNDVCQNGACFPGDARNCDDGNPCTTDSCDVTNGCQHTPRPDGASCGAGTCHGGLCS